MTKTVDRRAALTAKVNYQIENDWDYAYLEVHRRRHVGRRSRPTGRRTTTPERLQEPAGPASPDPPAQWVDLTATLPAGTDAGPVPLPDRRRCAETGIKIDNMPLNGALIGTAETRRGLDLRRLRHVRRAHETQAFFNAYIAENRQYDGYDTSLKTAYNFGFVNTRPDWVENYPYQNGLLRQLLGHVADRQQRGRPPGQGPHPPGRRPPGVRHWNDGTLMRPRILSYDSTFGLERTDAITLHNPATASPARSPRSRRCRSSTTRSRGGPADEHAATGAPRAATSPAGTASTCPRRARRSASSAAPSRATRWPSSSRPSDTGPDRQGSGRLTRDRCPGTGGPVDRWSAGLLHHIGSGGRPDRSRCSGARTITRRLRGRRGATVASAPACRRPRAVVGKDVAHLRPFRSGTSRRRPPSCGCSRSRPTSATDTHRPSASPGCPASDSISTSGVDTLSWVLALLVTGVGARAALLHVVLHDDA